MATDKSPIEEVLDANNNNADAVFGGGGEPTTQRRGIDALEVPHERP